MSAKKDKNIPLHIVDFHNDALQFILQRIGSKRLQFYDNLMIHFDSHPDLLLHEDLRKSDVYEKEILLEKVSIETWILPLVYAQHVNEIVWIKPAWSKQIDDGVYNFHIGETKDGCIKVSAPLLYFVSAIAHAPLDELVNPKRFTLHVITWDPKQNNISDCYPSISKLIEGHSGNYILDIDLDFFYTLNPFLNMYLEAKMYEQLKGIYNFPDKELTDSSAEEAQDKREKVLGVMEKIFTTLDEKKDKEHLFEILDDLLINVKDGEMLNKLRNLITNLHENYGNDVDWVMVHNAGTTVDDDERELPHHMSSDDEINDYISLLQSFLKVLPKPQMITIARSSTDEYCPEEIADQLQERVNKVLGESFADNIRIYNHTIES